MARRGVASDAPGKRREADGELVAAIAGQEPDLETLADAELSQRADGLRDRVRKGAPEGDLLPSAFALVREAARRTLGLRPFEVQLLAGIALHRGVVVEMATGEGKTLAAVAPVFLAALAGRGVHVLTVNDYLARRDAEWMGPVYRLLGTTVGVVQEGTAAAGRRAAYRCDVTYVTPREAGFDHLRDGLALDPEAPVHRTGDGSAIAGMALVDEADSILIDEARIPLVIAGSTSDDPGVLSRLAALVRELEPDVDYRTDAYAHNIFLTETGCERVEQELGSQDGLFSTANAGLLVAVRNALHAEVLLRRDVDYIVRGGSVELVDELTGRVALGRQWPDGLQAAVEAKEGLHAGDDGRVLDAITLQHFLELYPRLAGMTATATPAATELRELYGLEVVEIPSHRPCIRRDEPDRIFTHEAARTEALLAEIVAVHRSGRPILVGAASVAESERVAGLLEVRGVDCQVLNAKNDELEAAIVAEAGALGAVTISTNMAGRGTDIRLGGKDEAERDRVVELGGLYVIGTHRHESLRIDRQLRGRAGRQGDPGSSRFFVSLDDDLLRRYGIAELIPAKAFPQQTTADIDSAVVRREIDRAQRIVEGESFEVRRRLWHFSEILDRQRRTLQEWRRAELLGRAERRLLQERCPLELDELVQRVGSAAAREVERQLVLRTIDACWSEYLAEMQARRDEVHLVTLDGRDPTAEFYRIALAAFERLLEEIDERVVAAFQELHVTGDGVDWKAAGLERPSATWTYLVSDNVFGANLFLSLSNRASIGVWAVLLLWPVLLAWGLVLHFERRWGRPGGWFWRLGSLLSSKRGSRACEVERKEGS